MEMRRIGYVLELADGSQIQVGQSTYSGAPVVMKSDVPTGRLPAFTFANPPQGTREAVETVERN
jgi:hypothetical protein